MAFEEFINYINDMTEEKIISILIATIIIIGVIVLSSIFSYYVIKIFYFKEKNKQVIRENPFYIPLKILVIVIGFYMAVRILNLPETVLKAWRKAFKIILIIISAKAIGNIVDPKSSISKKLRRKDASNKDKTIAHFTGKIIKYITYIFGAFFVITELGYDVSALITGLGIGGAIVALAAQDVVKSFIAGIFIMTDKPFLVGDLIEISTSQGKEQGYVTDISLRSTKIRTYDNTILTLPNSLITSTPVMNWSRLKQRRFITNIKLALDTPSTVIERTTQRLKFILQSNQDVVKDSVQVSFDNIEKEGNNIKIYLYTQIVQYEEFLIFKQEINNQILKILESENIKLAYPGQNIYVVKKSRKEKQEAN